MKTLRTIGISLIILMVGFILGFYVYGNTGKSAGKDEQLTSYTNPSFGFTFKYPASWIEHQGNSNYSDLYMEKEYLDPNRAREVELSECIINESLSWTSKSPVREDCTVLLSNVTSKQRKELNTQTHPQNVIISVIRADGAKDLRAWLIDRYKTPDGELSDFEPSGEITMGGQKGYIATVGCCADYHVGYYIKKDDVIYELSTNYGEGSLENGQNELLNQIAQTFKFI